MFLFSCLPTALKEQIITPSPSSSTKMSTISSQALVHLRHLSRTTTTTATSTTTMRRTLDQKKRLRKGDPKKNKHQTTGREHPHNTTTKTSANKKALGLAKRMTKTMIRIIRTFRLNNNDEDLFRPS